MRVYRLLLRTKAEGPGKRCCIWVSGCNHKCSGCFATHLWDYQGGQEMSPERVIEQIDRIIDDIDGITFLGGEPFDQAKELGVIAKYMKEKGKNVISFSGYLYEKLLDMDEAQSLLQYTDLLCDGPFKEELLDYSKPMLGSANQRYIFLSDSITQDDMDNYHNTFEMRINNTGRIEINGMGNIEKLNSYLKKIGRDKDEREFF